MRKINKLFSLLAVVAVMGLASPLLAKEKATPVPTPAPTPEAPVVKLGGFLDTYYTYNFTNGAHVVSGAGNKGTFFNNVDDSYSLGLAEVDIMVTQGKVNGHFVLAYGQENNLVLTGVPGVNVKHACLTYSPDQWNFTLGRFVTWMGNEVIESKSNWNYSRSLMFWFTIPLWHDGMSVNFAPDSNFGITGYVTNGWNTAFALTTGKTYGLQILGKPDPALTVIVNGIVGPDITGASSKSRYVGEAIVTWAATDKFSLALDAEYGGQDAATNMTFWGVALYGRYQIESDWAAALRLEVLDDSQNLMTLYGAAPVGPATDVEGRELTLTLEHNFAPNMLARLEGRYDYALSGGTAYAAGTGPFAGGDKDQVTATASMALSF